MHGKISDFSAPKLNDKLKIWLEDFIERAKQVLNLDVGHKSKDLNFVLSILMIQIPEGSLQF